MKVPLYWLKEFVRFTSKPELLAEKLLLSGTKVESISEKDGEAIFDLEITPNRPDSLSVYGIAREVASIEERPLEPLDTDLLSNKTKPAKRISFIVKSKTLCPYYSLAVITDIQVKPSPEWLQDRLKLLDIRPINNVVDITNYVLMETGQPMHAFDLDRIKGRLTLRRAKEGEKVITLDKVERLLKEGDIIIEDEEKLVDLCGLMGGANSDITPKTNTTLLLVPIYDPVQIRKTSLHTGLRTESSNRFEKKLDPNMHPSAARRAVKLLQELASGSLAGEILSFGFPEKEGSVEFPLESVKQVLGVDFTTEELINLLAPLGFLINESPFKDQFLQIKIPSFRQDISLPEDIIEEIGRVFGYNNLPKHLPSGPIPNLTELFQEDVQQKIRKTLLAGGFTETTGYSLVSKNDLANFEIEDKEVVKVLHPTSLDFEYLRPNLLINLLKAIQVNKNYTHLDFFEIAKYFLKKIDPETKLPTQKNAVSFVKIGGYGQLKGVLEEILTKFETDFSITVAEPDRIWASKLLYQVGKTEIARLGEFAPTLLSEFDIDFKVFGATIELEELEKLGLKLSYKPIQKYPSVQEDFSIVTNQLAEDIISKLTTLDPLIKKIEVIDTFLFENQKSLTLRFTYQSEKETLNQTQIQKLHDKIEQFIKTKLKAKVREN